MIENREFDTVYHEHLCYFSLHSLWWLFCQHQLTVVHIERLPLHGGSLRLFVRKESERPDIAPTVSDFADEERRAGLNLRGHYADFGERVNRLGVDLWRTLYEVHRSYPEASIVGYGAAAKGNQLLSYFGIGPDVLDCVFDSTPAKQGRYMAGVDVPIVEPNEALDGANRALLLAWNFKDEIVAKHRKWWERGGRWIVPIPYVQVI
jgi:hypothetical protein